MSEEQKTRLKHFKRVIREHNAKTGYSFKLSKTDLEVPSKYAHPEHLGEGYKITCQMDDTTDRLYATYVHIEGVSKSIPIDEDISVKVLDALVETDAFKNRLAGIKVLDELQQELVNQTEEIIANIITDSITEREREDTYDTIMLATRKLYRK